MPTIIQVLLGFAGLGLVIGLFFFLGRKAQRDPQARHEYDPTKHDVNPH